MMASITENEAKNEECFPQGLRENLSAEEREANQLPSTVKTEDLGWEPVYLVRGGAHSGGTTYYWNARAAARAHGKLLALDTDEHNLWDVYITEPDGLYYVPPRLREQVERLKCKHMR
jgi:hypothetical protein